MVIPISVGPLSREHSRGIWAISPGGLAKRYRLDRTISYLQIEQRAVTHRDLRFIKDDEVFPHKKSTVVVHAGF